MAIIQRAYPHQKIVGVFGGGQLGRMLALAGLPLGLGFRFYEKVSHSPAFAAGEQTGQGSGDQADLALFTQAIDIATYEFENIPAQWIEQVASTRPVYPGVASLRMSQNRLHEKSTFDALSIPTAPWHRIDSEPDLRAAVADLGLPLVIKTATMGYDGKGQFVLREATQIDDAWAALGAAVPLMAESFVGFSAEVSLVAARRLNGEVAFYPLAENTHHQGILSHTIVSAERHPLQQEAEQQVSKLLSHLSHVGVFTVEFFVTAQGLVANETAPRVHNSGHWSIEGARCSQFENHLRAILDLPLGDASARGPVAMLNIVGRYPDPSEVLSVPGAYLHVYDKSERAGRKIGHITLRAGSAEELSQRMQTVVALLPERLAF